MRVGWRRQGDSERGRALAEESLELFRSENDIPGSAEVLHFLGSLAAEQAQWTQSRTLLEASLALFEQADNNWGRAYALGGLGRLALMQGDDARAVPLLQRTLALTRQIGDTRGTARTLNFLAEVASRYADWAQAQALFEESLALARAQADKGSMVWALNGLTDLAWRGESYNRTQELLEERLALERDLDDRSGIADALCTLGYSALHQGDDRHAIIYLRESLGHYQELQDMLGIARILLGFAGIARAQDQLELATLLLGAASAFFETNGTRLKPIDQLEYDRLVIITQARLDEATFAGAWASGRALPLEQAIAEALTPIRKSTTTIRKFATPSVDSTVLITDELWQRIAPHLPTPPAKKAGRPSMDDRQAMDAIFYVLETGCGWKSLPRQFGAASTVNDRFKTWRDAGVFGRLAHAGLVTENMLRRLRVD